MESVFLVKFLNLFSNTKAIKKVSKYKNFFFSA